MIKRLFCIALTVIMCISSMSITAYVADESSLEESITLDAILNFPKTEAGLIDGANTAISGSDEMKQTARFVRKDDTVYMALDDICRLTRSLYTTSADGTDYDVKQGALRIILCQREKNTFDISYRITVDNEFDVDCRVKSTTVDDVVYVEPEPLMSMLSATCTLDIIENKLTLLVDMPQYTYFETTNYNLNNYYVNVSLSDISDEDSLASALLKFGNGIRRAFTIKYVDSIINLKYEIFTCQQKSYSQSEANSAFESLLLYDIEGNENFSNIVDDTNENYNNLYTVFENILSADSENIDIEVHPFTNFYLDSYASNGSRDIESLEKFLKVHKNLSNNDKVLSKVLTIAKEAEVDPTQLIFNTVMEYAKRSNYDSAVLEKFKTTFSNETLDLVGFTPGEENYNFEFAQTYYNSCISPIDIVCEQTTDQLTNNISEFIITKSLDFGTGGMASKFIDIYETVLSSEKLRESAPNAEFKPLESLENSNNYLNLTIMQHDISHVYNCTVNKLKENEYKGEEYYNVLISAVDMYARTSALMIETLSDSWQWVGVTDKEKEILDNCDKYMGDLCAWVYKLEHCKVPEFLTGELVSNSVDTFDDSIFTNSEKNSNYIWYLEPTIEAENIIVIDNKEADLQAGYVSPFDECALIKQNGKYGIIKYNGTNIADAVYESGGYGIMGEISVSNRYDESKGLDCVDVFSNKGSLKIEENQQNGYGYGRSRFYWSNKQEVYCSEGSPVYEDNNYDSYNVVVQSANIGSDGTITDVSEKYGIANKNELLVPIEYDKGYMHTFNNIIALEKGGKWTYFDNDGKEIISNCQGFESNSGIVDLWGGFFDWMYDEEFDREETALPYLPTENFIPVKIEGKCGYYNTDGEEVIPCGTFEEVRPVHNGLAWVKTDGKWGVIQLVDTEESKQSDTKETEELIVKTAKLTDSDIKSEWTNVISLDLEYPTFSTSNKELQDYLNTSITEKILSYMDTDADYNVYISGEFEYDLSLPNYLSIYGIASNVPEGANGYHSYCYTFFVDLQNKKILTLKDLFSDNEDEVYSEIAEKTNQYVEESKRSGFLGDDVLKKYDYSNCKFTLNKEYLTVSFSPYEVASGIMGSINVEIPVSHINLSCVIPGVSTGLYKDEKDQNSQNESQNEESTASAISDYQILKAVNKYLQENENSISDWFDDSSPYCTAEYMSSSDTRWSCPINLDYESYSDNEIMGFYAHWARVDKKTLKCELSAHYEVVAEFDLTDYLQ